MAKKNKSEEVEVGSEEQQEAPAVEQVAESQPVESQSAVSDFRIKIAIKSLPFKPRGKAGMYRAGGVYVVDGKEGKEMVDAGIAVELENPCSADLTIPEVED